MTSRMTILTGAFTVAMLLTACAEDPLSNLDGEPAAVIPDVSLAVLNLEQDRAITASVVDGRLTPMAIPVSFTACDSDIDLAMDEDYDPVPATSTRAIITAQVLDVSCVVVTGAGFTDTVEVVNLPAEWETASLSATTLAGGDTLTVFATPLLKFNADSAGVTFTGGSEGRTDCLQPGAVLRPGPIPVDGPHDDQGHPADLRAGIHRQASGRGCLQSDR